MNTTLLYRPVGQREYELIAESGFRASPPRLSDQPFFYPLTNQDYAEQIARDWNTKDSASGFTGHVLRFQIESGFLNRYSVQTVGSRAHQEYWIPASDLEDFNAHILGPIENIATFK